MTRSLIHRHERSGFRRFVKVAVGMGVGGGAIEGTEFVYRALSRKDADISHDNQNCTVVAAQATARSTKHAEISLMLTMDSEGIVALCQGLQVARTVQRSWPAPLVGLVQARPSVLQEFEFP